MTGFWQFISLLTLFKHGLHNVEWYKDLQRKDVEGSNGGLL